MDELVAAAAAVDMADDRYAVDDMGQRGAQSASAATDVAAPAVDVMGIDGVDNQGCAAAEQLGDADPKVTKAPRAPRFFAAKLAARHTKRWPRLNALKSLLHRLRWTCSS